MLILGDMLQKLVDKIINDIGYNINIIDKNGIIVASGSKKRIGTFHKVALEAAKAERRIDISEENEEQFEGVKAGINQPFYYKGKLIGIIGITGELKEINEFTKIVKSMIELMYEQEFLKQRMYHRQSNKTFFLNDLLNITNREALVSLVSWGKKLGYDMQVKRDIMIIQLKSKNESKSPFLMEECMNEILKDIKNLQLHHRNDISTFLSSNRIVIMKASYYEEWHLDEQRIIDYAESISKLIEEKYPVHYFIATGSFYDDLYYIKESYFEAEFVVECLLQKGESSTGHISQYLMKYFLSKLPKEMFEHFFEDSYNKIKGIPDIPETIVALAQSNMNCSYCAKLLYVHRNTILFRLNKIKEILHLDPLNNLKDREYWILFVEYILHKHYKNNQK